MSATFTVLASGSSGNAALIRAGGFGLLIDAGVGPVSLKRRLAESGADWNDISAVVLTHTHSDHWKERTLAQLALRRRPVFCHETHIQALRDGSPAFATLLAAGLVETYSPRTTFSPGGELRLEAIDVWHDSHRTFGFRIEGRDTGWRLGFAADLGDHDIALIEFFAGVHVLAIEFNHDVDMLMSSRRPDHLIRRILGRHGHLSNVQAARLVRALLSCRGRSVLHALVPLHLSRECNTPQLALRAAKGALSQSDCGADVVLSSQWTASAVVPLSNPIAAIVREESLG